MLNLVNSQNFRYERLDSPSTDSKRLREDDSQRVLEKYPRWGRATCSVPVRMVLLKRLLSNPLIYLRWLYLRKLYEFWMSESFVAHSSCSFWLSAKRCFLWRVSGRLWCNSPFEFQAKHFSGGTVYERKGAYLQQCKIGNKKQSKAK